MHRFGAVAHLGERFHGMEEVAGSSPVSSTKNTYRLVTGVFKINA